MKRSIIVINTADLITFRVAASMVECKIIHTETTGSLTVCEIEIQTDTAIMLLGRAFENLCWEEHIDEVMAEHKELQ